MSYQPKPGPLTVATSAIQSAAITRAKLAADALGPIPTYAFASLPTGGSAQIAKVSDFNRGLWCYNGSAWLPVGGQIVFNPIDFGADPTGSADSSTAINAAIAAMSAVSFDSVGYHLSFTPGIYRLSASIQVTRRLTMSADVFFSPGNTFYLTPDPGVTAIVIGYASTSPDGGTGAGSLIKDLSIYATLAPSWTASTAMSVGQYASSTTYTPYVFEVTAVTGDAKTGSSQPTWTTTVFDDSGADVGTTVTDGNVTWTVRHQTAVWMRAAARLENLTIFGITGDGITVTGDVPDSNSNGAWISRCFVSDVTGNGLLINGDDTNAGVFTACNFDNFRGWAVWDASFLGNLHLGHQCASSYTNIGSYQSSGAESSNMFIGCYVESGVGSARIIGNAQIIGGDAAADITSDSDGFALANITIGTELRTRTVDNGNGYSVLVHGGDASTLLSGQVFDHAGTPVSGPSWFFRYDLSGVGSYAGYWEFNLLNSAGLVPFLIATNQQSNYPAATMVFGNGIAIASPTYNANDAGVIVGDIAAPTTGAHRVADLVINQTPSAGSPIGWRCVSAGTPGTWEELYASPEHRLSTTVVDLSLTIKQALYTVTAGRSLIVTKIVQRAPSATLTSAAYGFGFDSGATDVIATGNNPGTSTTCTVQTPDTQATIGAAAAVLGLKTTATQAATTMTIDVFGYLI
jgi:hypothetical protein